jgi:hypothetical protein
VDPLIWEGKARNGLKISTRMYRANNAKTGRGALVKTGKSQLSGGGGGSTVAGSSSKTAKKLNVARDDDDDDDDDDYTDDDDAEYKALIMRSSNALNRKVGSSIVGPRSAEKSSAPAAVPAARGATFLGAGNVPGAGENNKIAGFQDSCSASKETGELVAMSTGNFFADVKRCKYVRYRDRVS